MVQAGTGTDAVIDQLAELFEAGDIIVDGGNANFHDTIRREEALREHGHQLRRHRDLRRRGGRAQRPVDHARRLGRGLRDARPDPRVDRRGRRRRAVRHPRRHRRRRPLREDDPQRHRVRRHAAHRRVLRPAAPRRRARARPRSPTSSPSGTRATSSRTSSRSPPRCCARCDAETGKPLVDVIVDQAGSKGTGVWTVQNAVGLGVPVGGIAEAVFARAVSCKPGQRQAVRGIVNDAPRGRQAGDDFEDDVQHALYASKIVAYAQGFDAIIAGRRGYGWNIDKGAIAKIWRGGCIIRAQFLNRIVDAYERRPAPRDPARRRLLRRRRRRRRGRVAPDRRRRPRCPASRCPASPRRWPTTTRSRPSACPRH